VAGHLKVEEGGFSFSFSFSFSFFSFSLFFLFFFLSLSFASILPHLERNKLWGGILEQAEQPGQLTSALLNPSGS
jgi:hypothetical protein